VDVFDHRARPRYLAGTDLYIAAVETVAVEGPWPA
jgi:hypothetical protein